jgi:hypothetical protein
MRTVAFVGGFVLFAFALLPAHHAARAQGVELGACFHQTWALKTGSEPPDNLFFTAITSCGPFPVEALYEVTSAYQYNWDDGQWYPEGILLGSDASAGGTQFLGDSGFGDMPSYLGAACYAAVTGWTVQPYNWFPLYVRTTSWEPADPNPTCY